MSRRILAELGRLMLHRNSTPIAAVDAVRAASSAAAAALPCSATTTAWQRAGSCQPSTSYSAHSSSAFWVPQAGYASLVAHMQAPSHFVKLNDLRDNPGAVKKRKRWGRGDASDRGKTCGRGHKGQKARKGHKPGALFDGGTRQMLKFPKMRANPTNPTVYNTVSLADVAKRVRMGLLDPTQVITMKDLRDTGVADKTIRWGVKLLAKGSGPFKMPLHLEVSAVSEEARRAVEAAGGSVTTVYYNRLGLRALLKPEAFAEEGRRLPRPVRALPPKLQGRWDRIGALPPVRDIAAAAAAAAARIGEAPAGDSSAAAAAPGQKAAASQ